jgi:hypothetical protein
MLTEEEEKTLQKLLEKKRAQGESRSRPLAVAPRTVTICGIQTRFVPPSGAKLLRLSQEGDDWTRQTLRALAEAFPDLEEEYGIENLTVEALKECLAILFEALGVSQNEVAQR